LLRIQRCKSADREIASILGFVREIVAGNAHRLTLAQPALEPIHSKAMRFFLVETPVSMALLQVIPDWPMETHEIVAKKSASLASQIQDLIVPIAPWLERIFESY
jgi:hypothetical protein